MRIPARLVFDYVDPMDRIFPREDTATDQPKFFSPSSSAKNSWPTTLHTLFGCASSVDGVCIRLMEGAGVSERYLLVGAGSRVLPEVTEANHLQWIQCESKEKAARR